MNDQEPPEWELRLICLAAGCLFAFFLGALPTFCIVKSIDYPWVVGILSPLWLGFVLLLYLYVRMMLAVVADCCNECLNPWCDGCGVSK